MHEERVTRAIVDLGAIRHNVRFVAKQVGDTRILAAVKADAYGHGAVQVSRAALEAGASYLGVATVDEAAELRQAGIDAPILLFTRPFPHERERVLGLKLAVMVFDLEDAKALSALARALGTCATVHLKVDTGMGRLGCPFQQAPDLADRLFALPQVRVEGLATHFPVSDEADKRFTLRQIDRMEEIIAACRDRGHHFELVHAANSGAILDMHRLGRARFDMVRPGIMLYGYPPSDQTEPGDLEPAMTLVTRVIQTRPVMAGTPVSYGLTYRAARDGRLAVLPVGYADGYNRLLSNRGKVWINGRVYTISGRVCMDMCMVDVGTDPVAPGDEAVLMGIRPGYRYTAAEMARDLGTIPYEVTCWVSRRVHRFYIDQTALT
ncbi:MAG: alanine racemase [Bradymonadales bacterium]|nr:alanine racemase [Bradymonadales bacterium]